MMIVDYSDFPPLRYFVRVLKSCPKSALLYVLLWKKQKEKESIKFDSYKKDIRRDFLMSPTVFRNLLSPLMFLNVIHFVECDEKFQIHIFGQSLND